MNLRRWGVFFGDPEPPSDEQKGKWQAAIDFSRSHYYPTLIQWIEGEAMRPVKMNEGRDMVSSAARQNAFLEVRTRILSDIKQAQEAFERLNG